uniref:Alternative protein RALGAPA1 n=1 Tax=Homo sapiens TaxID=9606 RepID=L8EAR6_HUMAN|nr:alternative protein RALGAPA1 [Homo sapiens]
MKKMFLMSSCSIWVLLVLNAYRELESHLIFLLHNLCAFLKNKKMMLLMLSLSNIQKKKNLLRSTLMT